MLLYYVRKHDLPPAVSLKELSLKNKFEEIRPSYINRNEVGAYPICLAVATDKTQTAALVSDASNELAVWWLSNFPTIAILPT